MIVATTLDWHLYDCGFDPYDFWCILLMTGLDAGSGLDRGSTISLVKAMWETQDAKSKYYDCL